MKIYERAIVCAILVIHIIFVMLHFDPKLHVGGDDSDYIVASADFLNGTAFPDWHGSLYPIFLSPFIAWFGVEVLLLKIVSVIISVAGLVVLYRALEKRFSRQVIYFTLAINCFSYYGIIYAGTTYSEPLFIFIQALIVMSLFDIISNDSCQVTTKLYMLGLLCFLLSLTRNVGWGAWPAIACFFILKKKWKHSLLFSLTYMCLHLLWWQYKRIAWNSLQVGIEGQLQRIAYKNFYNPNDGSESIGGFFMRFIENSQLYLSKHLAALLGLRPLLIETTSATLTVMFYLLFVAALITHYRKNDFVLSLLIYIAVLLGGTFVSQQTHWDQVRLILVYLAPISIVIASCLDSLSRKNAPVSYPGKAILISLPVCVFVRTASVPHRIPDTIANLRGDPFRGYSEEWTNYANISLWAGQKIAADKKILCRKAGFSTVYGKRKFVGISNFVFTVPDSADHFLSTRNITYVILDNLSMPTVHRLLAWYLQKYPFGLKLIRSSGNNPNTTASIVEIMGDSAAEDHQEFLRRVQAGLLVYPDQPYYYRVAADRLFEMRDFTQAVTFYNHALARTQREEEKCAIYINRSQIFIALGEFEKASKDLNTVLTKSPDNETAARIAASLPKSIVKNQALRDISGND
ncbi:MAG TPA: hypothetical protein VGD40_02505 [Chryseosolibacter sp.]